MSSRKEALEGPRQVDDEPLAWEDLGVRPAGRAFRQSLSELMLRPGRFFRRMAVSGGLREPLTFFVLVLIGTVVMAFPAALAHFGLTAPDPERVAAAVYRMHVLPARVAGLLLVLLPLTVAVACGTALLAGTLFHAGGRQFSGGNWEGSVSVWLYSAGAALVPLAMAAAVVFAISLAGYLLGMPWPQTRDTTAPLTQWAALILCGAAVGAGVVLLVVNLAVGTAQAFRVDAMQGAAAGLAGLLLVAVAVGGAAWAFLQKGMGRGLIAAGAVVCVASALTALYILRSGRAAENA